MSTAPFLTSLIDTLGPQTVLTSERDLSSWLTDWRGLYSGRAQAVVRPASTVEVAMCIRLCAQARVPVVIRGGNTGLCGGATPDGNPANVVISLDRMNAIRRIDTLANTMVVDAGCVLGNLRREAQKVNRLLPLSLASEDSSQTGGNLATNAGGVNVVRYGMARELVLGIEAVLPSGEIFDALRVLRKDNTGYDLKQLLIGSEGTLGVITGAALRLLPRCDERVVVLAAVESPQQALDLYAFLFEKAGPRIQAFEFFTQACVELVKSHVADIRAPFAQAYPGYILVELADTVGENVLTSLFENLMSEALERDLCQDVAVSTSLLQLGQMWKLREEISEAQRVDGPHLKHDVSLPIGAIPAFMESTEDLLRKLDAGMRPFVFGHFGDGNLHYNVSRPLGALRSFTAEHEEQITSCILDQVVRYGGSISAEHGIGRLKREYFLQYKNPLEVRLMREIKSLLDPENIMNPGKLF